MPSTVCRDSLAGDKCCLSAYSEVIVITAPPGEDGDPFLSNTEWRAAIEEAAKANVLVIYLSSVGVYGDQGGNKVTEDTPTNARTRRAKRRLAAENSWIALRLPRLAIVRLPGIYGAFRGPLAKAREENMRIIKEGHVFSRIHVDDVANTCDVLVQRAMASHSADGLWPSAPQPGEAYILNCCDSEPAPQHEVSAYAYELLGRPVPPAVPFDSADLSQMQRSFYEESRLMSNDKLLGLVGLLKYPGYRAGLRACVAEEALRATPKHWGRAFVVMKHLKTFFVNVLLSSRGRVPRVALIDNGSLKPEATLSLRRLAAALEQKALDAGTPMTVEAVSARFADRIPARDLDGKPAETLPGWLKRVGRTGGTKVLLLPLLIGPSNTITQTLPNAARAVPELEVDIAPSLVCQCPVILPNASGASELASMLLDRLVEISPASCGAAGLTSHWDHILLCDHGSPSLRVTAAREAVRGAMDQLLKSDPATGAIVTTCCMERREGPEYDFNGPLLEDALLRVPSNSRVAVALLFLQEGRHAGPGGDIATIVEGVKAKRPDMTIVTSKVLAGHPALVTLLLERAKKPVPLSLLP